MQASQQLNKGKIFFSASHHQRFVAGGVFLAMAAFFGVFALTGHYKINLWPFPCGFKQRYNLPCPTCGVTTSVTAFARGKIAESFYAQPAAALLCCVLAISTILALFISVSGIYFSFLDRLFEIKIKYLIIALAIIAAAGWAFTLIRAIAENRQG
ncbi:MAG: DUF2752 domain-containing protein [Phycisphaerae bacterium]|nr:DUF2752 domain-containing protein [Phycisphaerae bacterium]